MKKITISFILLFIPLIINAQDVWEKPQTPQTQQNKHEQTDKGKSDKGNNPRFDPKYLKDAVPLIDGKVVFTLDLDVPGKDKQQIYDVVYDLLEKMTKEEKQFEQSNIAIVNKQEKIIAARYKEWLVFQNSFLSLDRTIFNYTIIAKCKDHHLHLTLSRISYEYETERYKSDGLYTTAEKWITDKFALNKSATKVNKSVGKFRIKTIDRKDEIFDNISQSLLK